MPSTATETDIVNGGLIKIGADPITALTDNVKAARLATARYQFLRDEVLASHPWVFAKKRAALAVDVTAPTYEFSYRFPIPSDYLAYVSSDLTDNNEDAEFKIENGYILTNDNATLNLTYIFRQTDTTKFDEIFSSALEWRIAAELAYPLIQSVSLGQACMKAYFDTLSLARSRNAQSSGSVVVPIADDWLNIRQ